MIVYCGAPELQGPLASIGIDARLATKRVPVGDLAAWSPLGWVTTADLYLHDSCPKPCRHVLRQGLWHPGDLLWPTFKHPILGQDEPDDVVTEELATYLRRVDKVEPSILTKPGGYRGPLRDVVGFVLGADFQSSDWYFNPQPHLLVDEAFPCEYLCGLPVIPVPTEESPHACHMIQYRDVVLVAESATKTQEILRTLGKTVVLTPNVEGGLRRWVLPITA